MAGESSVHGGAAHVAGGMHGMGQAWLGACMACMAGAHAWLAARLDMPSPPPFGW